MTYDELKATFAAVYGDSPTETPFELIAFNACMTGSYELANSIADFSRYMMGSEPSSNPIGYDIQALFSALANDPSVNGAQLGKVICDNSMKRLNFFDDKFDLDLKVVNAFSVIDLTKISDLRTAYENYFDEAAARADSEIGFSGAFARAAEARNVDRYSDTYTDLGLLAENTKTIMPAASDKLLKAIDKVVVHNKHGSYLKAKGISTFYPYTSPDSPDISVDSVAFKDLFLNQNSNYVGQKNLYKELFSLSVEELKKNAPPIEKDSTGHFVVKLTPAQLKNISSIQCVLLPVTDGNVSDFSPPEIGGSVFFSADDLKVDWATGTVTENFSAMEPVLDGHKILMFPTVSGRGHTFYTVPILYNGVKRNLNVRYNTATKKYTIVGFGSMIENGMVRLPQEQPQPGAVIIPLYMVSELKENVSDPSEILIDYIDLDSGKEMVFVSGQGEPFVFMADSTITNRKITAGNYLCGFDFISPNGMDAMSQFGFISIDGNNIQRFTQN